MAEETDKESNQEEVNHQQPMSGTSLDGTNGSSSIESIPQATSHSDSYYSSDIGSTEHLVVVLEAETSFSKLDPITQFITHNNNQMSNVKNSVYGDLANGTVVVNNHHLLHRGSLQNGDVGGTITPSEVTNGGDQSGGNDGSRRHSKSSSLPHGVKLCSEKSDNSGTDGAKSCSSSSSMSDDNINRDDKESTISNDKWANLEEELRKAQSELKAKNAEVEKLKGIRQQVEGELEDLTASLFQEAHKMVKEAKMKEVSSEKSLKEAKMQLEGLQAEVAALKALLITSTPSRPNLGSTKSSTGSSHSNGNGSSNGISLFKKQHKRCPSHNHLNYGRLSEDVTDSAQKHKEKTNEVVIDRSRCDVDPVLLAHFAAWRADPVLTREKSEFLQKMYMEEIDPCLSFANEPLVDRLRQAIEDNSIWVEPLSEKDRTNSPKECALLCCPRVCHYRMRFAFDSGEWFDISKFCRDRIAAVCEFLNYLRYIKNGLVKASVDDTYWEILRLRKQMALAKLGIAIS